MDLQKLERIGAAFETSKFTLQLENTLNLPITFMFMGIKIVLYMDYSLFGNK